MFNEIITTIDSIPIWYLIYFIVGFIIGEVILSVFIPVDRIHNFLFSHVWPYTRLRKV